MKFYPAILSDSLQEIQQQLNLAHTLPQVSVVQLDIIDGLFADNLTLMPTDLVQLEFKNLKTDFHLMADEPMNFVYEITDCQNHLPTRAILAQVEHASSQLELINEVQDQKMQIGLSLDIFTPLSAIKDETWPQLDSVQLMAIEAGFQGQELNDRIYDKVKQLQQFTSSQRLDLEIIVDGGANLENLPLLKQAGADAAAIGSLLWTADNPGQIAKQIAKI